MNGVLGNQKMGLPFLEDLLQVFRIMQQTGYYSCLRSRSRVATERWVLLHATSRGLNCFVLFLPLYSLQRQFS